jgi:hypothetical protein
MGKPHTSYYKQIWIRQVLTGRAASQREIVRRALALLDTLTRGQGPDGATFRNPAEMEAVVLQADAAYDRAARHKTSKHRRSKRSTRRRRRKPMTT